MDDMEQLQKEIWHIHCLIDEANSALNKPASNLSMELMGFAKKNFPRYRDVIGSKFGQMVRQNEWEKILFAGLVLGAAYVGAGIIDAVRDIAAHEKARKCLAAYYQELSVKSNMLIEEQQKMIARLAEQQNLFESERVELEKKCQKLALIISKIEEAERARSK